MRRKLGEMTKKYENISIKYQDLREIGLKEAERNFERLKKQSEERTAGEFSTARMRMCVNMNSCREIDYFVESRCSFSFFFGKGISSS